MTTRIPRSWRDKLADGQSLPKLSAVTGTLRKPGGAGAGALPAPREVGALIRREHGGLDARGRFAATDGPVDGGRNTVHS